jgi:hypothetical protein
MSGFIALVAAALCSADEQRSHWSGRSPRCLELLHEHFDQRIASRPLSSDPEAAR